MGLISFIQSLTTIIPPTGGPILWGSEVVLMGSTSITFAN